MDPLVAIILVLVFLVATVGWLALRRKPPELPSEKRPEAHGPPTPEALREPAELPKPEKEKEEAKAPAELPPGEAVEPTPAEAEPTAPPAAERVEEKAAPRPESLPPEADQAARQAAAYRKGLATTRGGFVARLARLFGRSQQIDASVLDEVEEVLLMADIGVRTTARVLESLRARVEKGELGSQAGVWDALRDETFGILNQGTGPLRLEAHRPSVILVIGVNGVGKTTTIGKLASRLQDQGKKVMLAAGDTFRAAAVAQLEVWGRRVGCPVVKGKEGADPSSVIFDAIKRAESEGVDVVIADTAGRLHTKAPLMEELKKVGRTTTKALNGRAPDEVLLVLDATTGQNAVQQAHMFRQALDLTGIVLTKLDGTAKGGVIMGIVDEHQIPVRFIGLGERIDDLREFDARAFVDVLFAKPEDESAAA